MEPINPPSPLLVQSAALGNGDSAAPAIGKIKAETWERVVDYLSAADKAAFFAVARFAKALRNKERLTHAPGQMGRRMAQPEEADFVELQRLMTPWSDERFARGAFLSWCVSKRGPGIEIQELLYACRRAAPRLTREEFSKRISGFLDALKSMNDKGQAKRWFQAASQCTESANGRMAYLALALFAKHFEVTPNPRQLSEMCCGVSLDQARVLMHFANPNHVWTGWDADPELRELMSTERLLGLATPDEPTVDECQTKVDAVAERASEVNAAWKAVVSAEDGKQRACARHDLVQMFRGFNDLDSLACLLALTRGGADRTLQIAEAALVPRHIYLRLRCKLKGWDSRARDILINVYGRTNYKERSAGELIALVRTCDQLKRESMKPEHRIAAFFPTAVALCESQCCTDDLEFRTMLLASGLEEKDLPKWADYGVLQRAIADSLKLLPEKETVPTVIRHDIAWAFANGWSAATRKRLLQCLATVYEKPNPPELAGPLGVTPTRRMVVAALELAGFLVKPAVGKEEDSALRAARVLYKNLRREGGIPRQLLTAILERAGEPDEPPLWLRFLQNLGAPRGGWNEGQLAEKIVLLEQTVQSAKIRPVYIEFVKSAIGEDSDSTQVIQELTAGRFGEIPLGMREGFPAQLRARLREIGAPEALCSLLSDFRGTAFAVAFAMFKNSSDSVELEGATRTQLRALLSDAYRQQEVPGGMQWLPAGLRHLLMLLSGQSDCGRKVLEDLETLQLCFDVLVTKMSIVSPNRDSTLGISEIGEILRKLLDVDSGRCEPVMKQTCDTVLRLAGELGPLQRTQKSRALAVVEKLQEGVKAPENQEARRPPDAASMPTGRGGIDSAAAAASVAAAVAKPGGATASSSKRRKGGGLGSAAAAAAAAAAASAAAADGTGGTKRRSSTGSSSKRRKGDGRGSAAAAGGTGFARRGSSTAGSSQRRDVAVGSAAAAAAAAAAAGGTGLTARGSSTASSSQRNAGRGFASPAAGSVLSGRRGDGFGSAAAAAGSVLSGRSQGDGRGSEASGGSDLSGRTDADLFAAEILANLRSGGEAGPGSKSRR